MTSDERYGITDSGEPSRIDHATGLEPDADGVDQVDADETPGWDLEAEPVGRTLAPAAEGPAPGVGYVELPIRAAAFAVDAALMVLISDYTSRAIYALLFSGILGPQTAQGSQAQVLYLAVILTMVGVVAAQAAAISYLLRVFRATPGQMAFGLFTLSRHSGRALSPSAAFVRWLCLYAPLSVLVTGPLLVNIASQYIALSGAPPADWYELVTTVSQIAPVAWFIVLIASVLLDERGRGLHDHLSGSVVVRRAGPPS
jgi:uncharacterized RDD family membrane protein YckC